MSLLIAATSYVRSGAPTGQVLTACGGIAFSGSPGARAGQGSVCLGWVSSRSGSGWRSLTWPSGTRKMPHIPSHWSSSGVEP